MTQTDSEKLNHDDLPEADIHRRSGLSLVWLIPLIALFVGGWLGIKAFTEKGPTVTITFKSAEGLEAGKTKIKYKDVELGKVVSIGLSEDLSQVVVKAELVKQAESFLSENTRFWIVRARVAAGEVSGLGTLFSGAYIGMDPGENGPTADVFNGLEKTPVVSAESGGRYFELKAERLGSLDIGSPVFYRQIKVGRIVDYGMAPGGKSVNIKIFVYTPHDQYVYQNTRFWNAAGLDASVGADGIKVNMESLVSILIGGIAFETPTNLEPGGLAPEAHMFKLYDGQNSIYEKTYAEKTYYLLSFKDSVRGLTLGAPVEFRGIKIGQVVDFKLEYNPEKLEFRIPVLIEIEPERMSYVGDDPHGASKGMKKLVAKGLRAQLKTGNLITGQLLVEINFYPDAPDARIDYSGAYPELPTIPAPLEQITTSIARFLERLDKFPLEQLGGEMQHMIQEIRYLVKSAQLEKPIEKLTQTLDETHRFATNLNATFSPELQQAVLELAKTLEQIGELADTLNTDIAGDVSDTLDQAQNTVTDIRKLVGSDSLVVHELREMLQELAKAAYAVRIMAEYIERNPESFIYGKDHPQ
jgi:paraquat-inducible protein B